MHMPCVAALISASQGLSAFSLAGLYSNHADLSPRHASLLLGITNTCGALPGIVGVTFCGAILVGTIQTVHSDPKYALFLLHATGKHSAFTAFADSYLFHRFRQRLISSHKFQDATGSWPLALFAPAIGFFVTGAAVFTAFGSSDAQDFEGTNQPFGFEGLLRAGSGPTKDD